MNPRGRTSASDRRWQERYKTIQERKWQIPGSRESRRRDRKYSAETYKAVPDESDWLDYGVVSARGTRKTTWDAIYDWYGRVTEMRTETRDGYVSTSNGGRLYMDELVDWFMNDAPTKVRDLNDDVSRWDASDLSSLFA